MRSLQVFARTVYGNVRFYPNNDTAHGLAHLMCVKTFTPCQLKAIQRLDIAVEVVADPRIPVLA